MGHTKEMVTIKDSPCFLCDRGKCSGCGGTPIRVNGVLCVEEKEKWQIAQKEVLKYSRCVKNGENIKKAKKIEKVQTNYLKMVKK